MSAFFGAIHITNSQSLPALPGSPRLMMGGHLISGEDCAHSGDVAAAVTGRLTNGAGLIQSLSSLGVSLPPSPSFSDLILSAYLSWGRDFWRRLEGPLCAAILDARSHTLLLARDPMGDGRVFYALSGSGLVFASRPDLLLQAPGLRPEIDREGLCQLFGLGPARVPGTTPIKAIRELQMGQILYWDGSVHLNTGFTLEARPHTDSPEATVSAVRAHLQRAVSSIRGLTPLCMLSGGLDSTLLTALLAPQGGARSFSVDYAENQRYFGDGSPYQGSEDAPFALAASRALRTDHHTVTLSQQSLSNALIPARRARFFPGMADVDSSLLLFCRGLSVQGKYVLSGECGDEVFGGYPWFTRRELIDSDTFPWSGSLALRASILRPAVRDKLHLPAFVQDAYRASLSRLPALPGEDAADARLRQLQGLCFQYFMANLQERALRMGEYAGISILTPYSDFRLAQYVYNVPWSLKTMGGMEKGLLREAARGLLPDDLRLRKKSPYPKTYHPDYGREVAHMCLSALRRSDSPLAPLLDLDQVERLSQSALSPRDLPWFGQLMTLPQMLGYLIQLDDFLRAIHAEIIL